MYRGVYISYSSLKFFTNQMPVITADGSTVTGGKRRRSKSPKRKVSKKKSSKRKKSRKPARRSRK